MSEILQYLEALDPAALNYTEWVQCGMALKEEGYPVSVWDHWSARDPARYKEGECSRKWETFHGSGDIVTGGTIYQLCKERGCLPDPGDDFDDDDLSEYHPGEDLKEYLEALFKPDDIVNIVTRSKWDEKKGKYNPSGCGHNFKVSVLLDRLSKYGDDIGAVIGDYNQKAGAWIRFNPMDGQGVKNENTADYRYTLIESDSLPIDEQYKRIRALDLPCVAVVHSGGRSVHAIVRIDAKDPETYSERVRELLKTCKAAGMEIDEQNKNSSRLSRLPGCMRGNNLQYLMITNMGAASWDDWKSQGAKPAEVESDEDLPELEECSLWDLIHADLPPIEFIIPGLLPEGISLLSSKPKYGKSFLALNLALCVVTGRPFMGYQTNKCHVTYYDIDNADARVTRERAMKMLSEEEMQQYANDLQKGFSIVSLPKSKDKELRSIGNGFEGQLRRKFKRDPELKLVIVDVLKNVRPSKAGFKKEYDVDYEMISAIKSALVNLPGVAVLFVTHNTKLGATSDWADEIEGSTGLTGGLSGSVFGIKKESRESSEAVLNVDSRLCKGACLKICFNEDNLTWECLGDNTVVEKTRKAEQFKDDYKNSPVVKTIKKGLELMGDPYETTITKMLESAIYWKTGLYGMTSQKVGREIERYTAALAFDGITITKKRTSGGRERIISFTTKEVDLDDWSESGKEEE